MEPYRDCDIDSGGSRDLVAKDGLAANNMNWADVEAHAVRYSGADSPDYQEGWVNGDKEIVTK